MWFFSVTFVKILNIFFCYFFSCPSFQNDDLFFIICRYEYIKTLRNLDQNHPWLANWSWKVTQNLSIDRRKKSYIGHRKKNHEFQWPFVEKISKCFDWLCENITEFAKQSQQLFAIPKCKNFQKIMKFFGQEDHPKYSFEWDFIGHKPHHPVLKFKLCLL